MGEVVVHCLMAVEFAEIALVPADANMMDAIFASHHLDTRTALLMLQLELDTRMCLFQFPTSLVSLVKRADLLSEGDTGLVQKHGEAMHTSEYSREEFERRPADFIEPGSNLQIPASTPLNESSETSA